MTPPTRTTPARPAPSRGVSHRRGAIIVACTLGALVLLCPEARAGGSVSLKEALGEMFSGSEKIKKVERAPDASTAEKIAKALGVKRLRQEEYTFYVGRTAGKTDGYAIVLNEMGKYQPITFIVGLDASAKVKMVEILKYREPVGGEVRDSRFRRQYVGKAPEDPIRVGRDIKNISGATISCRAVSHGVRKAVLLVDEMFVTPEREKPPAKASPEKTPPGKPSPGKATPEKAGEEPAPPTHGGKKGSSGDPPADRPERSADGERPSPPGEQPPRTPSTRGE